MIETTIYIDSNYFRKSTPNGVIGWTPEDGTVRIHPSSVNSKISSFPNQYLMYFTKQRSTAIFLHDTTCINVPILLFVGPNVSISNYNIFLFEYFQYLIYYSCTYIIFWYIIF